MDIEVARKALTANFESLDARKIKILGEGFDSWAFIVNDEYIFRFPKHYESSQKLEIEISLLPKLQQHIDFSIPNFEFVGRQPRNAFSFVGYRKIVGNALERDCLYGLDKSLKNRLIADLAVFIEQLHSFPVEIATQCGVNTANRPEDYIHDLERVRKEIYPMVNEQVREYCEKLFSEYLKRKENFDYKPALLHADISPEHILYDKRKQEIVGIIDFGDIVIGDPDYDLMYLYTDYGKGFIDNLLKYYSVDDYNRLFDKLEFFRECNTIHDVLIGISYGDHKIFTDSLSSLNAQAERLE
jgi:aminoglycoside 2''-phosphotransferase